MLPKINNKSFLECSDEDLQGIIDNPDYRENEYIDYKETFSFIETSNEKEKRSKIAEFRNDVCFFANAEGGYLIFGVSDQNGCAKEIKGIDIPSNDTDKFELNLRNNLMPIQPKTPYLKFHFVPLHSDKYIIIIYIKHDSFAPYTHIEDQKNYKMFKRSGNGKKTMTYTELKNMFNQSLSLDKEIYKYRSERIDYYKSEDGYVDVNSCIGQYPRFLLLHIIPETFLDSSYNQNMFILEKNKEIQFSSMFGEFACNTSSMPCVDGLRFVPYDDIHTQAECYVNNNGIIECFYSLNPNDEILHWRNLWDKIERVYREYTGLFRDICTNDNRVFLCISLIGCKDVTTQTGDFNSKKVKIDRNMVLCSPVCINNQFDDCEKELAIKKQYIEFLLSIGVKRDKDLKKFIKEIYDDAVQESNTEY